MNHVSQFFLFQYKYVCSSADGRVVSESGEAAQAAEHVEKEYGVSQRQRVKAFERMAFALVAKDIPRSMWKDIEKAAKAVQDDFRLSSQTTTI